VEDSEGSISAIAYRDSFPNIPIPGTWKVSNFSPLDPSLFSEGDTHCQIILQNSPGSPALSGTMRNSPPNGPQTFLFTSDPQGTVEGTLFPSLFIVLNILL
jgi:hypothetical protein